MCQQRASIAFQGNHCFGLVRVASTYAAPMPHIFTAFLIQSDMYRDSYMYPYTQQETMQVGWGHWWYSALENDLPPCVRACVRACLYKYMYVCVYICMCICMFVCVYVCMYVCVSVCVYTCFVYMYRSGCSRASACQLPQQGPPCTTARVGRGGILKLLYVQHKFPRDIC